MVRIELDIPNDAYADLRLHGMDAAIIAREAVLAQLKKLKPAASQTFENLYTILNPKDTAVLVIDIQNDYCSEKGVLAKERGLDMRPVQAIIPKINEFLSIARKFKVPIIWTQATEDPEYLKPNAAFKIRAAPKPLVICTPGTWGFDFYKIRPKSGDLKIIKKGYDSFVNPDLNGILRKKKIKTVIVLGVYTAVCVDTTVRSAYRLGYHVIVPRDLVSMPQQRWGLHEHALLNMDMIFAYVTPAAEIKAIWEKYYSR